MLDLLRPLAIFAKTVEFGSFARAAKHFNLSPSVVSHHVQQLEHRLGATLLYRTTRSLSPTADGTVLFQSARAMLAAAEEGLDAIAGRTHEPAGVLRVTLPALLLASRLMDDLASFACEVPRVQLDIAATDARQDLVREGIDLAIRIGSLEDSSLIAKRLLSIERVLVAAPSYLAGRPTAQDPAALATWDWVRLKARPSSYEFTDADGLSHSVAFQPRAIVDGGQAIVALVRRGLGLGVVPRLLVEAELADGTLTEVLPGFAPAALPVFAVWPGNAARNSLAQRLLRHLEAAIIQRAQAAVSGTESMDGPRR